MCGRFTASQCAQTALGISRNASEREKRYWNVSVVVFGSADDLDILEALVESNRQRSKTEEQVGREYTALKFVAAERLKRNQQLAGTQFGRGMEKLVQNSAQAIPKPEEARKEAAAKLGISHAKGEQAAAVV